MRLTSVTRVMAPPALCAALVFTAVGPAAAVTSVPDTVPAAAAVQSAIPGATELSRQVEVMRHTHGVPPAMTDFLTDVLATDAGRMPLATAIRHKANLQVAMATLEMNRTDRAVRADAIGDALADLQKTLDELLGAATSGLTNVVGSLLGVVTGLLDTVLGTVTGLLSGVSLPAAAQAETAALPATPALPAAAVAPEVPALP
ncbi:MULTISPECIES: hypothetical protein [unclassified Streptomyces]|uniref:hypothetical protein n=1 Tax=unclassified Streptomyces TaxID=2593676 RepID=UPI0028C45B6B|nr:MULTISPECIES: hypothetical protein [unclassified Streptomyces]WNO70838.1 hypothetical protein RPQ07_04025 [Streptomyces sp. AM8-1-1]